jgi:hypothetical protein
MNRNLLTVVVLGGSLGAGACPAMAQTPVPEAIAADGETAVVTLHADGAQVYECLMSGGALAWTFREPIATLVQSGKTMGRHYAGPSWEMTDGSAIEAKVTSKAAGATAQDIPVLKLAVSVHRGAGVMATVTTVQRLNTQGGVLDGTCPTLGATRAVAYSADYVFLKK